MRVSVGTRDMLREELPQGKSTRCETINLSIALRYVQDSLDGNHHINRLTCSVVVERASQSRNVDAEHYNPHNDACSDNHEPGLTSEGTQCFALDSHKYKWYSYAGSPSIPASPRGAYGKEEHYQVCACTNRLASLEPWTVKHAP
jgi:hypothetical protein